MKSLQTLRADYQCVANIFIDSGCNPPLKWGILHADTASKEAIVILIYKTIR